MFVKGKLSRFTESTVALLWVNVHKFATSPIWQDMAEIKEKADEIEDSIKYYERAADLYASEEVKTTGNNCNLKARSQPVSNTLCCSARILLPGVHPALRCAELTKRPASPSAQIAALSAQLEDYQKAIGLFEEVAKASLDNNLLRYSVKACRRLPVSVCSLAALLHRTHTAATGCVLLAS